ncbi:hypothetical protein AYO44_13895 [Planctomycetaceae bacterium SCGC AG-212-F19]|nr:hypothetical protein AYO44_13895 [Planctomycetaceae bacterium SCGC AG-212-F19]
MASNEEMLADILSKVTSLDKHLGPHLSTWLDERQEEDPADVAYEALDNCDFADCIRVIFDTLSEVGADKIAAELRDMSETQRKRLHPLFKQLEKIFHVGAESSSSGTSSSTLGGRAKPKPAGPMPMTSSSSAESSSTLRTKPKPADEDIRPD